MMRTFPPSPLRGESNNNDLAFIITAALRSDWYKLITLIVFAERQFIFFQLTIWIFRGNQSRFHSVSDTEIYRQRRVFHLFDLRKIFVFRDETRSGEEWKKERSRARCSARCIAEGVTPEYRWNVAPHPSRFSLSFRLRPRPHATLRGFGCTRLSKGQECNVRAADSLSL